MDLGRSILLCGAAMACSVALAQDKKDLGKMEYESSCAVCHGASGKGGGPYVELLKKSPPDLTMLSKNNGGVFPMSRVYAAIEGAGPGHGTRDMPVWGKRFAVEAGEYFVDVPYNHQAYIRGRILSLVEYLNRLQAK